MDVQLHGRLELESEAGRDTLGQERIAAGGAVPNHEGEAEVTERK
jgi:hypothetical protein